MNAFRNELKPHKTLWFIIAPLAILSLWFMWHSASWPWKPDVTPTTRMIVDFIEAVLWIAVILLFSIAAVISHFTRRKQ